jgi:hypothetical protein
MFAIMRERKVIRRVKDGFCHLIVVNTFKKAKVCRIVFRIQCDRETGDGLIGVIYDKFIERKIFTKWMFV